MSDQLQYTRATRTVRVTSADGRFYADVEILMALALLLPNGFEIAYNITTPVNPSIIDNTGQGLGRSGDETSTRMSHIELVNGTPGGPTASQYFYIEVCDAFTLTGPNSAEHLINCPSAKAVPSIVDDVGAGLAASPPDGQSRCQHVVKYTQQLSDTTDNPTNYAYGLITDCMTFDGPPYGMPFITESAPSTSSDIPVSSTTSDALWMDAYGLVFESPDIMVHGAMQPNVACNDLTNYTTDPTTGEQVPPPPGADDLNIYVHFPSGSGGPFLGDATPPAPAEDAATPGYNGIDMGPIWWIRKLGVTNNVWYWYVHPVQQPLVWSYFGPCPNSPYSGNWGYVGWQLLPFTTVTWILNDGAHGNYSQVPVGTIGAVSLETAASGYIVTSSGASGSQIGHLAVVSGASGASGASGIPITTNWFGTTIPDGGFGCSTTSVQTGAYGSGLPIYTYTLINIYMPFGALPMTDGTSDEVLAYATALGRAAGGASGAASAAAPYRSFGGPPPNIWQLTGLPQPPLTNPDLPWNPTTNPHLPPSLSEARQAAQTFATMWNATANGINSAMQSFNGKNISPEGNWPIPANSQPPGWAWKVPYPGGGTNEALGFHSNILPFMVGNGVPLGVWYPATIPTIAVDQLNPTVWNNSPPNFAVTGPVKWATGAP